MSFFLFIVLLMPLLLVYSHPINMICVPVCNTSISANETLINHWLSNNDSTGIDQLMNKEGTVTERLLKLSSTEVSICMLYAYGCIHYQLHVLYIQLKELYIKALCINFMYFLFAE